MKIFRYDITDSTNTRAKEYVRQNDCECALFIANAQSAGRGRQGKSFYSPDSTGLYMTYVYKTDMALTDTVYITTAASVAVLEAIKQVSGKSPLIKWVNDIYLEGKKICGILCETVTDYKTGRVTHLIIGVGINLETTLFPKEIEDIAGSLGSVDKDKLSDLIVKNLEKYCINGEPFLETYRQNSLVIGNDIVYIKNGVSHTAHATGIDDNGGLIINENGTVMTLSSGEISVKINP